MVALELRSAATAVLVLVAVAQSPVPLPFEPQLTCEVYKLCHEFAGVVMPAITPTQSRAVYDALQLGDLNCTKDYAAPPDLHLQPAPRDACVVLELAQNRPICTH